MVLKQHCEAKLKEAQAKIEKIKYQLKFSIPKNKAKAIPDELRLSVWPKTKLEKIYLDKQIHHW